MNYAVYGRGTRYECRGICRMNRERSKDLFLYSFEEHTDKNSSQYVYTDVTYYTEQQLD